MNAKSPRILKGGLLLALTLVASGATGCATPDTVSMVPYTDTLVVAPYEPVKTYVAPPPTVQFWAPGGNAAINAQLMNHMR